MISERDIIYITKKQASLTIAALIAFCILIFMLGYFWGKQSVTDEFGQKIVQDLAQDAGEYEVATQLSHDKSEVDELDNLPSGQQEIIPVQSASEPVSEALKKDSEIKETIVSDGDTVDHNKKWQAVLIGFGSKMHAKAFMNRLQKYDIFTQLRVRESKSSSGKHKKQWYQVLTDTYATKSDVEQAVAKIQKLERIKSNDIKIF